MSKFFESSFGLKLRYWICIFWRCIWVFFNSVRVKLKKVSKLSSIRVSHTLGPGREIQYKSICLADFDTPGLSLSLKKGDRRNGVYPQASWKKSFQNQMVK